MTAALVLAGGGAKGSFQIGALQFLYEHGFCADIICSTSVGSVNALQLAHGGTPETQKPAFEKLKSIWETELKFNQDMYDEAPWLKTVDARTREVIVQLIEKGVKWEPIAAAGAVGVFIFPPLAIAGLVAFGDLVGDFSRVWEALKKFETASSIWTLEPTRAKLQQNLDATAVRQSGVELRLVAASLDSGAVRYVTQDGEVLDTDRRPVILGVCVKERNAYNGARAALQAAGKAANLASRDKRPEAVIDLDEATRAATRAKDALDQCLAKPPADGNVTRLTVPLVKGTIASAAIPCIFPPEMLGNEAYVDGGVRWQLPVQAAIDLGPEKIVAINTSLSGVQPAGHSFQNANMLDIAQRASLGLELWETQESHWRAAKLQVESSAKQLWMITPRVEVHDTLHVDPGLIDINIAYGYMCAADVLTGLYPAIPPTPPGTFAGGGAGLGGSVVGGSVTGRPGVLPPVTSPTPAIDRWVDAATDPVHARLVDGIALCRRRCWELEHQVFGYRIPTGPFDAKIQRVTPKPNVLHELRVLKTLLWLMVLARRMVDKPLPPGALSWSDQWERHRWARNSVPRAGANPWAPYAAPKATPRPVIPQPADPSKPPTVPAARKTAGLVAQAPDENDVWVIEEARPYRRRIPDQATLLRVGGKAVVKTVPRELLHALAAGRDFA